MQVSNNESPWHQGRAKRYHTIQGLRRKRPATADQHPVAWPVVVRQLISSHPSPGLREESYLRLVKRHQNSRLFHAAIEQCPAARNYPTYTRTCTQPSAIGSCCRKAFESASTAFASPLI